MKVKFSLFLFFYTEMKSGQGLESKLREGKKLLNSAKKEKRRKIVREEEKLKVE